MVTPQEALLRARRLAEVLKCPHQEVRTQYRKEEEEQEAKEEK
jgi:hypothetical protein